MDTVRRGAQYPSEARVARQVWDTRPSIDTSRLVITKQAKSQMEVTSANRNFANLLLMNDN